jgi:signal transduction histidine kinase/CheY-like chemotaxis protein/HPt (histidine-containing phosphotransfer) domain-containing protein
MSNNLNLRLAWLAALTWTLVVSGSLIWNVQYTEKQTMDRAYAEATANLNKDIVFRRWATEHGGVYVPLTETQQSNPWLSHVPGRDVKTTDGRALTLLNPFSMLQQIMDRYARDYGIRGRSTGLKQLNPDNAPDDWEKEQLEAFTKGVKTEVWSITELSGQPHLRYLRAMFMEPGCEKCHAILGYKTGDMRGATGLNLPLAPYYQQIENARRTMGFSHLAIWLLGLIGIGWSSHATSQGEIRRQQEETERKKAEQALAEHHAHLEDTVLQRTAELSQALEAAQLADRTKDAFLANMSHELRTPLGAVIGMAGLARGTTTDPKQRDYLDKIALSGNHLSRIINDLLDLSKIAAGHMAFETVTFSLRGLLGRCNSALAHRTAENGLKLVETIDPAVPDVLLGDPVRVEQIIFNLVGNAIKFTASGHIEVRVGLHTREEKRICLAIEVEDTGMGIRPEDMARLFKPFSQANETVSRAFGGTGLGLAISKRLAEMMGGDISVTSREGSGSTFRVTLWLGLGQASDLPAVGSTALAAAQAAAQTRYQGVCVLVVDDQPFNREIVEGLLTAVGISPYLAENGQQALDIISGGTKAFDLVLMDVQMPVMDGLTATRAIRNIEHFATLPIIAMTAHTMAHEKDNCIAAGMNDHIGKPFDEASFYSVLAKWVSPDKQTLQPAAASVPATAVAACSLPALRGVDTRAGLALLLGNEARYRHWLSNFVYEAPITLQQIRPALASGDTESASAAAHALKGRAGMLGMGELNTIAAALESAIDHAGPADELLHDLEENVGAMIIEIQHGLGLPTNATATAAPLPGALPPGLPPACIARLISSLQAGDGDCDLRLAECLSELEGTVWISHLQRAQSAVGNFDFAMACTILSGTTPQQLLEPR